MPTDGELPALPSGDGWPVMEVLVVLPAWCWWLLLKISSSLSRNKLEDVVRALDLGSGVMATAMCRSRAAEGSCLLLGARRGGENGGML